ncbi:ThiF family adenylyltransferase [Cytobacillus oceanisediminis]|uniref:ThiF family adenylyltransferase n=1 Tax=Cytobacillus oceanisediminis TaxID=665099 RepID=UPI00203C4800|nr:ThiF family adenylyltransferase [Cytobacillus oceanisediminis]MCM3402959.1 ThiF family adenylyltransferase [Cytobacillus oceanisediminis]
MNSINILEDGKKKLYFDIVQVGAGANGGQFFRSLCQDIATHFTSFSSKKNQQVTFGVNLVLCDADRYEGKNLANQLCLREDIGEFKVEVLAERYADVYDVSAGTVTMYVKTIDMLDRLFAKKDINNEYQQVKVLIGHVDNNKTRQLFHDYFYSNHVDDLIWIDTGVTGVEIISKPIEAWTDEERVSVQQSGLSGQVVVGFKYRGEVILEPVTQIFPDMLDDATSNFPDESCGELIINNPQRSATNRMAALLANNIMNNLFHSQSIYNHVLNFNAQTGMSGGRTGFISNEQTTKFESLKEEFRHDFS